jgi:hypothetical protein
VPQVTLFHLIRVWFILRRPNNDRNLFGVVLGALGVARQVTGTCFPRRLAPILVMANFDQLGTLARTWQYVCEGIPLLGMAFKANLKVLLCVPVQRDTSWSTSFFCFDRLVLLGISYWDVFQSLTLV